jgi:purine nucleosidase
MATRILFDTDPGIDDAMALLMLARDPRAELVGISTVFGNAPIETTTANALALCERFGIDAPVASGAAHALGRPPGGFPEEIHGRDGMGNVAMGPARARRIDARPAAEFIAQVARANSGALVLVAVGPLTNLALALRHDPELPRHVRQVVLMGGAFGTLGHSGNITPLAEANIHCDPHAAAQVLAADWPVTLVGLDVTHQVLMRTEYLESLARDGGAEGRFIWDITRCYEAFYRMRSRGGIGGIHSHDASAVACALDDSAFTLRRGAVQVVLDGDAQGQTLQAPVRAIAGVPQHAAHSVCVGVDAGRLLAEYRALFTP